MKSFAAWLWNIIQELGYRKVREMSLSQVYNTNIGYNPEIHKLPIRNYYIGT